MRPEELPTFEDVRRNARNDLSEARDWLISDWQPTELTDAQAAGLAEARRHISLAKAALDEAARS